MRYGYTDNIIFITAQSLASPLCLPYVNVLCTHHPDLMQQDLRRFVIVHFIMLILFC